MLPPSGGALEWNIDRGGDLGGLARFPAARLSLLPAAKQVAEIAHAAERAAAAKEIAEEPLSGFGVDVGGETARPTAAEMKALRSAAARPADRAELIVLGPLLFVGEDFVRGGDVLEFLLGRFVSRIAVRVPLPRELAVRLLDLVFRGGPRYAEEFVQVLGHGD